MLFMKKKFSLFKQTGGVAISGPPTYWSVKVIKRFIYHSVSKGAKFVDFSHFHRDTANAVACSEFLTSEFP